VARVPDAEGEGDVAESIRARRPGGVLRPIDRVLLHSPQVANGWNTLLGTIRGGMNLRADLRELIILRIAVLNHAPYEWASHEKDAVEAGLSADQMSALRGPDPSSSGEFDDLQLAVLAYTDTITRDIAVPDAVFAAVSSRLDTQDVVEVTLTIAAYNMVSRLVVAMDVEIPTIGAA
jgi:4-carboxymuconolactone decarboxylase